MHGWFENTDDAFGDRRISLEVLIQNSPAILVGKRYSKPTQYGSAIWCVANLPPRQRDNYDTIGRHRPPPSLYDTRHTSLRHSTKLADIRVRIPARIRPCCRLRIIDHVARGAIGQLRHQEMRTVRKLGEHLRGVAPIVSFPINQQLCRLACSTLWHEAHKRAGCRSRQFLEHCQHKRPLLQVRRRRQHGQPRRQHRIRMSRRPIANRKSRITARLEPAPKRVQGSGFGNRDNHDRYLNPEP